MTILDNFTNPLQEFNQQTHTEMQQIFDIKLQRQTSGRRLGNKYHKKLEQIVAAYSFYDKLMSRVIDNPKYIVRESIE